MNKLFTSFFGDAHLDDYCSGVFSDELDILGHRSQVVNGFTLNNSRLRCFGRVRTLTLEEMETDDERISLGLGFLGKMAPDEVLVVKGSMDFAYFGELMTRLSMRGGLAGAVIDGLTRDTYFTQTVDFPVFAKGYSPKDIKGRGRVASVDEPVTLDGVNFTSGDYLFGDADAVVAVPAAVIEPLSAVCRASVTEEQDIKKMIADGLSVDEILNNVKAF